MMFKHLYEELVKFQREQLPIPVKATSCHPLKVSKVERGCPYTEWYLPSVGEVESLSVKEYHWCGPGRPSDVSCKGLKQ